MRPKPCGVDKVKCGCGCGTEMDKFDWRGRERKFIVGHNNRKEKTLDIKYVKRSWHLRNKTRLKVRGWLNMICSKKIPCGCGCGEMIYSIDKRGRPVKRLADHTRIGKEHTLKTLEKMRDSFTPEMKEAYRINWTGKNNPKWRGGIDRNGYPSCFNLKFRKEIYERDGGCVICQSKKRLHVHHIDLFPGNSTESNCITLCIHCHLTIHGNIKRVTTAGLTFRTFLQNKYGYNQMVKI